jgi:unsaturated chondroitin disaccharide hydrolase
MRARQSRQRGVRAALAGALALAVWTSTALGDDALDASARHAIAFARTQVTATDAALPSGSFPQVATRGSWTTTDISGWTSGFLPGSLWSLYQATGDPALATEALNRQAPLAAEASDQSNSDLGFVFLASSGNAYRLLKRGQDSSLIQHAAATLALRYNPTVGALRSRDGGGPDHFKVIVDTLMSAQVLYAGAALGGNASWKTIATQHALTTLAHNVRPDGSVIQLVDYDPSTGAVQATDNTQAFGPDTTWARGEAWALAGFAGAYAASRDARILDGARRVASFVLSHSPADGVPYWDYEDPAIPSAPRDSSSAAINAVGLYSLALTDPDAGRRATYAAAADHIVSSLTSSAYLAEGSGFPSVLLHVTHQYRLGTRDVGSSYADYFLLQALLERRLLPPAGNALHVDSATASKGKNPAAAVDGRLGTKWSTKGDGQWLKLDLGSAATVHRVSIAWVQGDQQAYRFDVRTSVDGSTFTTATSAVSSGASTDFETFDVAPVSARYVELVVHAARPAIAEVQVR